jgi:hypothetical protein
MSYLFIVRMSSVVHVHLLPVGFHRPPFVSHLLLLQLAEKKLLSCAFNRPSFCQGSIRRIRISLERRLVAN